MPSFEYCANSLTPIRDIANTFTQHPELPGVIIARQGQFVGVLTRARCFEALGRPFGIELFQKLPVREFQNKDPGSSLLLDSKTRIEDAVVEALKRGQHEAIPLSARIFSIIDVWDALRSDRCYRSAWSTEDTREYIQSNAGKLFDPVIVKVFLEMMDESMPKQ